MENMHIAHDCVIGSQCIIGNSTKLAGEVTVDDFAIISATVLVHQFCRIGGYVMIQGGSRTSQDIPPYIIAGKEPIRYAGVNLVGLRRRGFANEQIEQIHEAYRIIYSKGNISEGMKELKATMEITPQLQYVVDFIESSKRGILK
jgi:UDP-N-acetylglucosamine acyltransferase